MARFEAFKGLGVAAGSKKTLSLCKILVITGFGLAGAIGSAPQAQAASTVPPGSTCVCAAGFSPSFQGGDQFICFAPGNPQGQNCASIVSSSSSAGSASSTAPGGTTASTQLRANLFHTAQQTSQVGLTAIHSQTNSIRDALYRLTHPQSGRPLGFAGAPATEDKFDGTFKALDSSLNTLDNALEALAYRDPKSPLPTKAPAAAAPTASKYTYAAWAQAFGDYESRRGNFLGTDIGRNTRTGGVLGGVDLTVLNPFSATDALALGLLSGETTARVNNADGSTARVNGPSVGAYGVYVNGIFSMDGTVKVDFLNLATTTAGIDTPLALRNYVAAGNLNFKQDMGTWFWEPTVGGSYTRTHWDAASQALGMSDGTDIRTQAGVRFGSGSDWGGMRIDETLSVLAYDDVLISGGSIVTATTPLAPTDMGKVFGQVIGKLEATLTSNWSAYVEGEVRGHKDIFGAAGRVGARYKFN